MERAPLRKLRLEGIPQCQKQQFTTGDKGIEVRHSVRANSLPMKKLLAQEMSKDKEPQKRTPNVVARLMGVEGLPSPKRVHRQQRRYSDSSQQKNASITAHRSSQTLDTQSRRSSREQQEFKDVYEDLEASHRCSSRWKQRTVLAEPDTAFIQQKLLDAEEFSADEMLQQSEDLDDMLECKEDRLLKFLKPPESWGMKHSNGPHVDFKGPFGSPIAVLTPVCSEKYENSAKAWSSVRRTPNKLHSVTYQKRKESPRLEPNNRHRAHISQSSPGVLLDEGIEEKMLPTRIVLLKPKQGNFGNSGASCSSLAYLPLCDDQREYRGVRGDERPLYRKAREIARRITVRMRDGWDEFGDAKSAAFGGYIGDESSYESKESDSESDPEPFQLPCRELPSGSDFYGHQSSFRESSVSREAKKRLSERWKRAQKYPGLEMASNGSTLAEMLALSERDAWPTNETAKGSFTRTNNVSAENDVRLGFSRRDGRKEEGVSMSSSRSMLLSTSFCTHGELAGNQLLHNSAAHCYKNGNLNDKQNHLSEDSNFCGGKPHAYQHQDKGFSAKVNSKIHAIVLPDASAWSSSSRIASDRAVRKNTMLVKTTPGSVILSSTSSDMPSKQQSCGCFKSTPGVKNTNLQELHDGPMLKGSIPLWCQRAEPEPSVSYEEADHPSPVSVLEVPCREDTSSCESFERVNAELHELRKQLQLLRMESSTCTEASVLPPVEEETTSSASENENGLESQPWQTTYAVDVLVESSHLEDAEFGLPDDPLDPKVFDNLEKKYDNGATMGSKPERKLLFDRLK